MTSNTLNSVGSIGLPPSSDANHPSARRVWPRRIAGMARSTSAIALARDPQWILGFSRHTAEWDQAQPWDRLVRAPQFLGETLGIEPVGGDTQPAPRWQSASRRQELWTLIVAGFLPAPSPGGAGLPPAEGQAVVMAAGPCWERGVFAPGFLGSMVRGSTASPGAPSR